MGGRWRRPPRPNGGRRSPGRVAATSPAPGPSWRRSSRARRTGLLQRGAQPVGPGVNHRARPRPAPRAVGVRRQGPARPQWRPWRRARGAPPTAIPWPTCTTTSPIVQSSTAGSRRRGACEAAVLRASTDLTALVEGGVIRATSLAVAPAAGLGPCAQDPSARGAPRPWDRRRRGGPGPDGPPDQLLARTIKPYHVEVWRRELEGEEIAGPGAGRAWRRRGRSSTAARALRQALKGWASTDEDALSPCSPG